MSENSFVGQVNEKSFPHLFERMLGDEWAFGVKLKDGTILPVGSIAQMSEAYGTWWIDFNICQFDLDNLGLQSFKNPTSRNIITVRADDISMIFELMDT